MSDQDIEISVPAEVIEAVPPSAAVRPAPVLVITPEDVSAVREYCARMRDDYVKRISEIEAFLGFTQQSEDLGIRIARLESFLGVKPA